MSTTFLRPRARRTVRTVGDGALEVFSSSLGELPVLRLRGSREQMGWQHGALAGDLIRRNADMTLELFCSYGFPGDVVGRLLDSVWERLQPHTPEAVVAEIEAVAAGARSAGHSLLAEDVRRLVAVTNLDMYRRDERLAELMGAGGDSADLPPSACCTFFAVWGDRTDGGRLFASRNLDWVSQTGMHEARILSVYEPDDGLVFVTMGYAGVVGALAGMNEKGVCFSQIGAFSGSEELDGTPWVLIARKVLEEGCSLDVAADIVRNAKHTIGLNYLVADGSPEHHGTGGYRPGAVAFETNFTCCEAFVDDDAKERSAVWLDVEGKARAYGLPLKNGLMRADIAFSEKVRSLQAADNGPVVAGNDGNPFTAQTYVDCHKPMYDMFRAYETGGEYVFALRGQRVIEAGEPRKIGRDEALNIAATVAHNTEKLDVNDWNVMSVVYAPTDLEFYVAYETCDTNGKWKNAPDSGYWHFRFEEIMRG